MEIHMVVLVVENKIEWIKAFTIEEKAEELYLEQTRRWGDMEGVSIKFTSQELDVVSQEEMNELAEEKVALEQKVADCIRERDRIHNELMSIDTEYQAMRRLLKLLL